MAAKDPDSGSKLVAMPLEQARRARGEALMALPRSKVASLRAFRRIRADRIFGAAGLALVLVGVLLIFAWEKPPPVEKRFGVEWPQTNTMLDPVSDEFAAGDSETYTFPVNGTNVTAVTFWLTWIDDVARPSSGQAEGDTFEIQVSGPEGSNVSFTERRVGGQAGMNMSYTLPMSGIPDVASVPAKSEEEARAALGDRTNQTGGGDWTITVRLVSANHSWESEDARNAAGGMCPPQSIPNVCTFDPGNSFELHFQFATYEVQFKKLF